MSDHDYSDDDYSENGEDQHVMPAGVGIGADGEIYAVIPPLKDEVAEEEIPLSGIDENMVQMLNHTTRMKAAFCQSCGKYYSKEMVAKVENDQQCFHCTFWLYYSPEARAVVDGIYGMTIADYILKCYSSHDTSSCSRNIPNVGGCFLCDFINKVPIFDIIDVEKVLCVQFEDPKPVQQNPDEDEDFVLEI